jgi:SAM-dependent methyltransferase
VDLSPSIKGGDLTSEIPYRPGQKRNGRESIVSAELPAESPRQSTEAGHSVRGEASLAHRLLRESGGHRVLDAGCGTGRVAIELAARGYAVVGVDADADLIAAARMKAPHLDWRAGDLSDLADVWVSDDVDFDLIILAGNVMVFLAPGAGGHLLAGLARQLAPGALLVAGFDIREDLLPLRRYDALAQAAGLEPFARWATWDRAPFAGGDYAVSVHRRTPAVGDAIDY